MVGKASEWLQAEGIGCSLGHEFEKLSREQPAFASLVSWRNQSASLGKEVLEACRRREGRSCKGAAHAVPDFVKLVDQVPAKEGRQGLAAQFLPLVDGIRETVEEEVHDVCQHGLTAFLPGKICYMAVGIGMIGQQNFANNADFGTGFLMHGNGGKVPGHGLHVAIDIPGFAGGKGCCHCIGPFFDKHFGIALGDFIGQRVLRKPLQHVSVEDADIEVVEKLACDGKARLGSGCFVAAEGQRRDIGKASLFEGTF